MPDLILVHDTSQRDASIHITIVIVERDLHALTDTLHRSEVHHRIDRLYIEDTTQEFLISNIADMACYRCVCQFLETLMDRGFAVGEIVDDDRCIARLMECDDCMGADIAESSGDENVFGHKSMYHKQQEYIYLHLSCKMNHSGDYFTIRSGILI